MMSSIIQETNVNKSSKQTMNQIDEATLLGSRGNSGIIFAQFLNGLAEELEDKHQISVTSFANAVRGCPLCLLGYL